MNKIFLLIIIIMTSTLSQAQVIDTLILKQPISKYDTITYKRIFEFDRKGKLFHVRDYFESGQIQMRGTYSSLDPNIKEEYWCNYISNTKEGVFITWYNNGQMEFKGSFKHGIRNGLFQYWYKNGHKEAEKIFFNNQLHGKCKYYSEDGSLQYEITYEHGLNKNPKNVKYRYLLYTAPDYDIDTNKLWPLIIYLHGGSARGSDLMKLYAQGIPDQIYRGRKFPFIIASPQCPKHLRWSTDNWFNNFYNELIKKYRIDTNRVYLTGVSLGGSGTWYLAVKYPNRFAAIAPISGFTSHIKFINDNIDRLKHLPVWAFHGKKDLVVPFEETEQIIIALKKYNSNIKFTIEPEIGHWIHWLVYPKQDLFDWFLKQNKLEKNIN
ncbi:MAG: dienelactone hydrolase family protein [Candidatus Helarchaeota archaeon]